jgi:hypothetical protein
MTEWVIKAMTDEELKTLRQSLEDGNIPNTGKYATIQRLIESHLLANRVADNNYDHGLAFADALDDVIDALVERDLVTRVNQHD